MTKFSIQTIIKFFNKNMLFWYFKGKPVPPPHLIKQEVVKKYSEKFAIKIFIETGTYLGEMIDAVKEKFEKVISIELDKKLFYKAKNKFSTNNHIEIINGDSAKVLFEILTKIEKPTLFWLDGHYSGGTTAKGDLNTPIYQELNAILSHKIKNHIILIDDARLFIGKDDYPMLSQLQSLVLQKNPRLNFEYKNDIIRIYPKTI
ncbi:hypothetical protein KJ978_03525 [Patescibacteria group bacterium]|nr:hypothetical protein [Patescibacteria group bacterium]MBU1421523.1 hypothetical protein [Patescibacteria group bacterium]MBU2415707.1 hypothetical protein [Patescibacteria group bacterium]